MSLNRNCYVIVGYDLTCYKTDNYDEWRWTEEGKKYLNYQSKGHIRLFDDPMSSQYLYFGYVLACGDEYDFDTIKISIDELSKQESNVWNELRQLIENGVIDNAVLSQNIRYEVIVFEEYI